MLFLQHFAHWPRIFFQTTSGVNQTKAEPVVRVATEIDQFEAPLKQRLLDKYPRPGHIGPAQASGFLYGQLGRPAWYQWPVWRYVVPEWFLGWWWHRALLHLGPVPAAAGAAAVAAAAVDPAWNANVDPVLYEPDRATLKRILASPDNQLEKQWATRRLLVHTPRGNVCMYYDIYREGFAYYCDQSGLNYRILNAVAMKYVMTYRCLDFFMDEATISPHTSPLLDILMREERREQTKKVKTMKNILGSDENDPFVKFKAGREAAGTKVAGTKVAGTKVAGTKGPGPNPNSVTKPPTAAPELHKNKFIYMGKMRNMDMLRRVPKPVLKVGRGKTQYDAMFSLEDEDETAEVVPFLTYKSYKSKIMQ
jgi:hypothetical protein